MLQLRSVVWLCRLVLASRRLVESIETSRTPRSTDESKCRGKPLSVGRGLSKFKPLAMAAADKPGAFLGTDEAQAEGELDANDLKKIEQVLAESGYITIPEELLERSYGGPTLLRFHGSGGPSWWDRFFGSF
ncbi:hypothetical protein [Streptomyces sp. CA-146814]|uniref:hypothetical protein n=1 Tax=Streptomyces sp. CA-146814 TaxID=3240053 RepID=UPI003D8F49BD